MRTVRIPAPPAPPAPVKARAKTCTSKAAKPDRSIVEKASKTVQPATTLTTREAATIIGVTMGLMLHLLDHGQVSGRKILGRWHFDPEEINAYAPVWAKRCADKKAGLPVEAWPTRAATRAARAQPDPSGRKPFVLPEVMRNWPILDERDRPKPRMAYPTER